MTASSSCSRGTSPTRCRSKTCSTRRTSAPRSCSDTRAAWCCSPAQQAGVPIFEFPPAEIKKAVVGTGAATKEQVQFMLTRLLRLKTVPQPSDAADGVAAALAYVMSARVPTLADGSARASARA